MRMNVELLGLPVEILDLITEYVGKLGSLNDLLELRLVCRVSRILVERQREVTGGRNGRVCVRALEVLPNVVQVNGFLVFPKDWEGDLWSCVESLGERIGGHLFLLLNVPESEDTCLRLLALVTRRRTLYPNYGTLACYTERKRRGAYSRIGWFPLYDREITKVVETTGTSSLIFQGVTLRNFFILDISFDLPGTREVVFPVLDEKLVIFLSATPINALSLEVTKTLFGHGGRVRLGSYFSLFFPQAYDLYARKNFASESPWKDTVDLVLQSISKYRVNLLCPRIRCLHLPTQSEYEDIVAIWTTLRQASEEYDLSHLDITGLQVPISQAKHLKYFPGVTTVHLILTPTYPHCKDIYKLTDLPELQPYISRISEAKAHTPNVQTFYYWRLYKDYMGRKHG